MDDNAPMGDAEAFIDYREQVYGEAVDCWTRVAQVWSGILGHHVNATDAALCMVGLKAVRAQICPDYSDNIDDVEGYGVIFRKIVGEDMIHAKSVTDYISQKWPQTNGDVWAQHGHPGQPCNPPDAVHGNFICLRTKR